jgi:pimeloyl-ACP methyl ester carboxylesterase
MAVPFIAAGFVMAIISATSSATAATWRERPVRLGDLHGTLTVPDAGDAVAAALILAGSGPVDRDGNLPGTQGDSLKMLAHDLAGRGIPTLRIDKRGIGASKPAALHEEALRLDTYVTDAVSWLDVLQTEGKAARLFLIGHSEGALIATLAARQRPVTGLVLLAGAGEPAAGIVARQLAAAGAPPAVLDASRRVAGALARGETVADVPPELRSLYRQSVQNYIISWFARDPAAELARVSAPALIVQGTTDLQILVEDADKLAAARPDARRVLIEGMNHALKTAPAERAANLATYVAPGLPLAPELVPAIAAFVAAR